MKTIGRSLAAVAVTSMIGSQAFGQAASIMVADAPIHKVPSEAEAPLKAVEAPVLQKASVAVAPPVEFNAPPNTLNAQLAALTAPPSLAVTPVSQPRESESRESEGPTAAIAPSIIDAAGAFEAYMRQAGAIDAKFVDGAAIAKAVSTGSGYEMAQFQEGMVAYAALTALQEAQFVQAVYDVGRDPRDRDEIAAALLGDPKSVLGIEGASAAAATVGGILAQMGAELVRSGQGIRKAAYDVQRQPWSKEAAPEPQKRLAEAKQISAKRIALNQEQTTALMQNLVALRMTGATLGGRAAAPSPVVLRGLAVAALAVLGRAGDEDADKIAPLLSDAKSADCMKMAKLNLYQCLAVAGPHYEHAYCLGQHAVMDTGQCVISASGQSLIPAVTPISAPEPPAPVKSRSVSVPMALISPAGPERSRAYARGAAAAAGAVAEAPVQAPEPVPSREEEAPAPRQAAREERYAAPRDEEVYEREPEAPARRDERYDRYAQERYAPERYAQERYDDRYAPYGRGYREMPQDYDPYAYEPPAYAYRYGR